MNVSLTPRLEKFVQKKVASGRYGSASEVIREALRSLDQKDRDRDRAIAELRAKIKEGADSLDRGEGIHLRQDELKGFFEEIMARGRARLAKANGKRG